MLRIAAILIMLLCSPAPAGHRVALIIGGTDELETKLNEHAFTVTRTDGSNEKLLKETLHLFLLGVPTKGTALVYTDQKEPGKILKRLQDDTGATKTLVLTEEDDFSTRLSGFLGNSGARKAAFLPDQIRPGNTAGDEWVNAYGMVFCWCPDKDGGFWMGKYEVTKREFNAVTRKNPRNSLAVRNNHPRDGVHYDDIINFVRQINQRERFFKRVPEGWEYGLPTESQWVRAASADEPPKDLAKHANFADASLFNTGDNFYHYAVRDQNDQHPFLAIVGSYPANSMGIHDLLGNVWEWTDTYSNAHLNPKKPGNPIACGGSWVSMPFDCTVDSRRQFPKRTEKNFIGLRLVLRPESGKSER